MIKTQEEADLAKSYLTANMSILASDKGRLVFDRMQLLVKKIVPLIDPKITSTKDEDLASVLASLAITINLIDLYNWNNRETID